MQKLVPLFFACAVFAACSSNPTSQTAGSQTTQVAKANECKEAVVGSNIPRKVSCYTPTAEDREKARREIERVRDEQSRLGAQTLTPGGR